MKQRFGTATAFTLVVGSMVGTGVFTSLGFQLAEFESGFVLMFLWVLGGICAFCGAVSYCELAAAIPRSGGEYAFLGRVFHPAVGFVAGWISFTVGFSAPAALMAMTFGAYLEASIGWIDPTTAGVGLLLVITALHAYSHQSSSALQVTFTFVKITLIVLFCIVAYLLVDVPQDVSFLPRHTDLSLVASGGFAVSLIYVNYAYAGWNTTTYVTEEFNQPTRTINKALMTGTATVLVLYVLLNGTFLSVAPVDAMKGKIEVGFVAASFAFGDVGAQLMSLMIALILVSTLSATILAGPRVLSRIGNDYPVLRWLAKTNRNKVPAVAILTQSALAILLILTGEFESILVLAGLLLGVSAFSTVCASIWMRIKHGKPVHYRMPFYPLPPIVFLIVTGWAIGYTFFERAVEAVFAATMILVGLSLYGLVYTINKRRLHQLQKSSTHER